MFELTSERSHATIVDSLRRIINFPFPLVITVVAVFLDLARNPPPRRPPHLAR